MTKRNLIGSFVLLAVVLSGGLFFKKELMNLYVEVNHETEQLAVSKPTSNNLDAVKIKADIPENLLDYFSLQELLENREYHKLEDHFSKLIALLENDISIESSLGWSISALTNGNPEYETLLNQWVEQYPNSAAAYLVRGNYFHDVGYLYRGTGYYRELSEKQIEKWKSYSGKANKDLSKSLKINPNVSVTYADIINNSGGTRQEKANLIAVALDAKPESYLIRSAALRMSRPRWGGSMDALEALVEDTKNHVSKNLHLKPLLGYVDYEIASAHYAKQEYYQAKQAFAKALAYGESNVYLSSRAYLYFQVDEKDKAIKDFNRILELFPGDAVIRKALGRHYLTEKNYEEALKHFSLAAELRPYDYDIQYIYGWALDHFEQYEAAEKAYKKSLQYAVSRGSKSWMNLGNLYSEKIKNRDKAKYSYVMAVMTNVESPINWFNYSLFLGNNKDCDVMGAAYMHTQVCGLNDNKRDKHCAPKYLDRNNGILTGLPKEGMCPSIEKYIEDGKHPLHLSEKFKLADFLGS